jgi:hypothetical protein
MPDIPAGARPAVRPICRLLIAHRGEIAIRIARSAAEHGLEIAGCVEVIIATKHASLGMGGTAMIEGGGPGVVRPGEVGPMAVHEANRMVDAFALLIVTHRRGAGRGAACAAAATGAHRQEAAVRRCLVRPDQ